MLAGLQLLASGAACLVDDLAALFSALRSLRSCAACDLSQLCAGLCVCDNCLNVLSFGEERLQVVTFCRFCFYIDLREAVIQFLRGQFHELVMFHKPLLLSSTSPRRS